MIDLKQIRRNARSCVKRHYVLLTLLCAISIFVGTEFNNVLNNAQTWYEFLRGRQIQVALEGIGIGNSRSVWRKVVSDVIDDNIEAGNIKAAERMALIKQANSARSVLGRQRGVLAALVNNVSSGNVVAMISTAVHSAIHTKKVSSMLLVLGGLLLYLAVWAFLRNAYRAVLRRSTLEARRYQIVPPVHLLHIRLVKRWRRAALTLLLETVYESLWYLTIVGGIIKHYSYFLVPFIVAENPDIKPRDAILLSRRMMDGHKWECCKLELSFLGWFALGFVTFGAVDVLWGVPYRVASYTEYYTAVRAEAKRRGIEGVEQLNDDCLYQPADADTLRERYADIARTENIIMEDIVELPPVKRLFARNFGIWMGTIEEKKVYGRQAGLRRQTSVERLEMNGRAYPRRMNPLWDKSQSSIAGHISYLNPCTVWTLVMVFFAFCIVGWVWEVALNLIRFGQFSNRGMLHGPWLPIYGFGVVMIAVLLNRFRSKPVLEALAIIVLCGFMEYMTSFVTEQITGMRWWDYTGYFLNLHGRICGEGLVVFMLGGMMAVYLLVPAIDALTMRLKPRLLVCVCLILMACFTADLVYSFINPNKGDGITNELDMIETAAVAVSDDDADTGRT
ncbi:MAG: DUF975 family protein [Clostridia bacterium]|nr:DUF975 family protein [Clostridia bacterium]